MPTEDNVVALLVDCAIWEGRGEQRSLTPNLPDGDPLETPPDLPDYPTDVPAPEPHDVPAWEPVDDPPPETPQPPEPRPIP
jgi:hypothetical protein